MGSGLINHSAIVGEYDPACAAVIVSRFGAPLRISPRSGHWQPPEEHFRQLVNEFDEKGARGFQIDPTLTDDEHDTLAEKSRKTLAKISPKAAELAKLACMQGGTQINMNELAKATGLPRKEVARLWREVDEHFKLQNRQLSYDMRVTVTMAMSDPELIDYSVRIDKVRPGALEARIARVDECVPGTRDLLKYCASADPFEVEAAVKHLKLEHEPQAANRVLELRKALRDAGLITESGAVATSR